MSLSRPSHTESRGASEWGRSRWWGSRVHLNGHGVGGGVNGVPVSPLQQLSHVENSVSWRRRRQPPAVILQTCLSRLDTGNPTDQPL